jgi:hypothetical protein
MISLHGMRPKANREKHLSHRFQMNPAQPDAIFGMTIWVEAFHALAARQL